MSNLSDLSLLSVFQGVGVVDRPNMGIIKVTGGDRLRFLHNQSTNNINILKVGEGCMTVFVNSTGRTLDLVTVYVLEEELLLLVSPERRQFLMEWLDRFIFPFDQVSLTDVSEDYSLISLLGLKSANLLDNLGLNALGDRPENSHVTVDFESSKLLIAVGNDLKFSGYNLILPRDKSAILWEKINQFQVEAIAPETWEKSRILQGRPAVNKELTEDYNPLEAGLWDYISFNKGCYIGQETIARLNTYQGVKQRLWGINLTGEVTEGETITLNGAKVGILTSFTSTDQGYFALGYIRTKAGGEGLEVEIGNVVGKVVSVPFLKHEYL
jgi:folate-binding protein YgfZ